MLIPLAILIHDGILGTHDCGVSSPDQNLSVESCRPGFWSRFRLLPAQDLGSGFQILWVSAFCWQVEMLHATVRMYSEDEWDKGRGNAKRKVRGMLAQGAYKWRSRPSQLPAKVMSGPSDRGDRHLRKDCWPRTLTEPENSLITSWDSNTLAKQRAVYKLTQDALWPAGRLPLKASMRTLCLCLQPLHFPTEFQRGRECNWLKPALWKQ